MENEIIDINSKLGGTLINSNSLSFACDKAKGEKNVFRRLSYIIRAIVVDHSFDDMNKSTATIFTMRELDREGIEYNPQSIQRAIRKIARQNISNLKTIEKMIRRTTT